MVIFQLIGVCEHMMPLLMFYLFLRLRIRSIECMLQPSPHTFSTSAAMEAQFPIGTAVDVNGESGYKVDLPLGRVVRSPVSVSRVPSRVFCFLLELLLNIFAVFCL